MKLRSITLVILNKFLPPQKKILLLKSMIFTKYVFLMQLFSVSGVLHHTIFSHIKICFPCESYQTKSTFTCEESVVHWP